MANRELKDVELFVFTYNLVFESVFYKGKSKRPLMFGIVLRLHQVQMRGYLILHVVNTIEIRMTEKLIYGIPRGNNMGVIMRGLNPPHFLC